MLKSYLLVAWRNLLRNKLFSLINISGLSIGMAAVFLIYMYVQSEHSFDRYGDSSNNIYRVPLSYIDHGIAERGEATNYAALASALKANFPEVEESARISSSTISVPASAVSYEGEGKSIQFNETKLFFADATLIPMFGFQMLEGDAKSCLSDPYSLVMTKATAIRYFGNEPALSKAVRINGEDYKITGVVQNLPPNTHFNFDLLASYETKNFGAELWGWSVFNTYVKLIPGTDRKALEQKFPVFLERYMSKQWAEYGYKTAIDLQPVSDIHLQSHLAREMKTNGNARTVYFVGLLGSLILAIAWINYINLSTAKAMDRAKEVGMRKVSGASRRQLVVQFLLDAVVINICALMFAGILVTALLPAFETLAGSPILAILTSAGVMKSLSFWTLPSAVFVCGIVMVGLYPSLLLSSFKPVTVLKGKFVKSASGAMLRKGLVGFQYVLSVFLIAGTITISRQISFMQSQYLGYNAEQMLIVKGPSIVDSTVGTRFNYFRNEQMQVPAVVGMGKSTNIPGRIMPYVNSVRLFGQPVTENATSYNMSIDDQFFPTYEIPFVAGKNLTENDRFSFPNIPAISTLIPPRDRTFRPAQNKVIINEKLSQLLGFKNPEDALRQRIRFGLWDEFTGEIAGVVKNYHQRSLQDNYEPILYFFGSYEQWPNISIRLKTNDLPGTIDKIKVNYAKAFPGNPFEYQFLDDYFNEQYKGQQQFEHVFSVLTALAIIISCLGLLGLSVFTVGQRIREIGIRKVLGAPVVSILLLFCKDSVKLVLISCALTLPVIWYAVQTWLNNFAFHIGLELIIFIAPAVILLLISMITIVTVSLRAAVMNPVESLRVE